MARKISKNSRAARQAEAYEPEAKSLENLPRAEKTDLAGILVRTAAKNEALLDAKLQKKRKDKSKVGKKHLEAKLAQTVETLERERLERALNINSKLDGKIAKSMSRAKYVQSSRKAGWESTNEAIRRELNPIAKVEAPQEMEKDEDHIETFGEAEEREKLEKTKTPVNLFELLPAELSE